MQSLRVERKEVKNKPGELEPPSVSEDSILSVKNAWKRAKKKKLDLISKVLDKCLETKSTQRCPENKKDWDVASTKNLCN